MGKGARTRQKAYDNEDLEEFLTPRRRVVEEQPKTVVQPSKFFGEPGEDIEKWLKGFKRISKANGWSEKRQCDILPAFLRDRAAEYYDELQEPTRNDFEELKSALIKHFIPKKARCFFYADLYARKQGETESAEDFGREIQLLVWRAYAEMPFEHQDTLMREHFVNGLRPSLKRIVLISDPKDFIKALEVAKREEINDQVTNGSAPWVRSFSMTNPNQVSAPVAATSAEPPVVERLNRLENMVEKLSLAMAESKKANEPPNFGRQYNWHEDRNLRTTDGRPICNFCKRVGHVEAKCRTKQNRATKDSRN